MIFTTCPIITEPVNLPFYVVKSVEVLRIVYYTYCISYCYTTEAFHSLSDFISQSPVYNIVLLCIPKQVT